jgi:16S rRNA (guanine527-N7)-methyltransferase
VAAGQGEPVADRDYAGRVDFDVVVRAVEWAGWSLTDAQLRSLEVFGSWLRDEAIPAGGVGPNETERISGRHLADSLLFAGAWPPPDPPATVVDLGSGVGLPGVPLSILWPQSRVSLVERSGRRVDSMRRVRRMLDLENVEVIQGDAARVEMTADLVVARGAAEADVVKRWGRRIVLPGGRIVVGGSHTSPPAALEGEMIIEVPVEILDHPVWLRMMAPS